MATLGVSVGAWAAPDSGAQPGYRGGAFFHPALETALGRLEGAREENAILAAREVWRLWDRADPAHVEAALESSATRRELSPWVRAYLRTLGAYARLRRGDLFEARRGLAELGYVDAWSVLGPFDNSGKAGLERADGPETELGEPLAWGRAYSGHEGRPVRWREAPRTFPYGWVDAAALLRPRDEICAFFATHVEQPGLSRRRPFALWVGARGAYRLYVNGVERLSDVAYRGHDFDRRSISAWLEPGPNQVLVKVCAQDGSPMLSLRLAGLDGAPDPRLKIHAAAPRFSAGAAGLGEPPASQPGALQRFEARVARARPAPADQRAFARYLEVTDGDDPARHRARDLAQAAASADPTVEGLLLTARLAPDHNERRRWLSRARAALERAPAARLRELTRRVLVAEARWHESGLSPRAALPLYEQALSLDPHSVEALLGQVRLYDAAGLKRSALSLVESAVAVDPHAVALLNLRAAQLDELGYQREASEASNRYAALRFDDHRPLLERLELAIERRQPQLARHWTSRLLSASPDSVWARGIAARAELALGSVERALALHQQALALSPDDVEVLERLADLRGELNQQEEQLALLQHVLTLQPQNDEVRRYVEALAPAGEREDEAYAWAPERFLKDRLTTVTGFHSRTLLDLTVTRVYDNGLAGQFRQIVFQPLTEAGASARRHHAFTYQADRQRAQLRGARVYRAAGGVDEAVQSAEGPADSPELSMYTSARTVHVQLPRLEVGDVVELRYRIDDTGSKNDFAGYFGELRYFESEAPVDNAEYVVITPESQQLYVDARGLEGLEQTTRVADGKRVHRFLARGLDAVRAEPAMPPWPEVLGFVHVSTYPSYSELGAWYWGLSRDELELDDSTRKLAESIARGHASVREKVVAVYEWVVKNTRYVALEFGIYGYKPRPCVTTVARGWGDCKDKATVIVALLSHLGIDAQMVLVRTGMRGRFESTVASLAPFDHAIAYVPELDLYLDGTAEFLGSRELPQMDRGAFALRVSRKEAKVVTLPDHDPDAHFERRRFELRLARDGGARIQIDYELGGPGAAHFRRRYAAESTRRARFQEDVAGEFPGFELGGSRQSLSVSDLSDFESNVEATVRGHVPRLARREGERLSLSVLPRRRLTGAFASLPQRRLPLAVGGFASVDESVEVALPPGHRVVSAPESRAETHEFGAYSVEVSERAGRWVFRGRLELAVSRVPPERYPEFRRFCQRVDAAFEPRLIVEAAP